MTTLRRCVILCFAALLAGCASPTARIDAIAERAGLKRAIVHGKDFRHVVYTRDTAERDDTWTVYLESDGRPWIDGRAPAADPTTRAPLALQLMLQSSGPALYVTRPCYHELRDSGCAWQQWTLARYSAAIVDSMVAAIQTALRDLTAARIRLVGYSGGGTLAVLIAERLSDVEQVVTLAANLDTDAWTRHHDYLPLEGSLNPAFSPHAHRFREIHLQGAQDVVVPPSTTRAYFDRYPAAERRVVDDFDHVCCWTQRQWTIDSGQ